MTSTALTQRAPAPVAPPVAAAHAASRRRALLGWVAAIVGWSASTLFVRAAHANALVFATWRLWLAVPVLGGLVLLRRRRGHRTPGRPAGVSRGRWLLVVVGAGALFVGGVVTTFAAIGRTSLLDVTLIGALQPVLIVGFAVAFLGERARASHLVRGAVAVAGTALVALSGASGGAAVSGDLLALAAMVLGAAWFLYGRVLRDRFAVDPLVFMLGVLGSGAVLMTVLTLATVGHLGLGAAAIGFAAATMVTGTTAHVLVVWAHRYLPTSVSAPLLLAEPPLVGLAAWLCFGQAVGVAAAVGSAVVLVALLGVVRSPAVEHVEEAAPDPAPPA